MQALATKRLLEPAGGSVGGCTGHGAKPFASVAGSAAVSVRNDPGGKPSMVGRHAFRLAPWTCGPRPWADRW
jgi:hypothetical protein